MPRVGGFAMDLSVPMGYPFHVITPRFPGRLRGVIVDPTTLGDGTMAKRLFLALAAAGVLSLLMADCAFAKG